MKFLQRAIKEDRKGPYVNYGPMRFRPSEPRITKFCLDEKVAVNLRFYYFNQLEKGDPKYFRYFQNNYFSMQKWDEIHTKLNKFKSPFTCGSCHAKTPTKISVAGSGQYGYSVSPAYITCDDPQCQSAMLSQPSSGAGLYPLGFDLILQFGWNSGNRKYSEQRMTDVLREIAGWTAGRIIENNATEFIDKIVLR